jgi:hypothetical protein
MRKYFGFWNREHKLPSCEEDQNTTGSRSGSGEEDANTTGSRRANTRPNGLIFQNAKIK